MEQQDCQDLALLGSAERYQPLAGQDLQRAKYAEFHECIRALPRSTLTTVQRSVCRFVAAVSRSFAAVPEAASRRDRTGRSPNEGDDMNRNGTLRRGLAIATVVSALGAPAASAAPVEQFIPSTVDDNTIKNNSDAYERTGSIHTSMKTAGETKKPSAKVDYSMNAATGDYTPPVSSTPATPAPVRVVQVSADSGFDWGDAGIGAGGLLALAAIASGALVAIRHRPAPGHTAA
jgi:hypothetical protein